MDDEDQGDESPDFGVAVFAAVIVVVSTVVTDPFLGPAMWYLGLALLALVSIRAAWAWLRTRV